jgi:transcriptional regulator with XRE-family HTH domain
MVANINPTVRRRRLGAELRWIRMDWGLTRATAAERLMVSQPKISHIENGRRAIKPGDVRDLCAHYGVTDQQVVDSLLDMARESAEQDWWNAHGEHPQSLYIGLETDAASIHTYEPMAIPGLLQTPAYALAVIEETIPPVTAEQAAGRLKVRLRRQHRIYDPASPLRLWVILDESVLHRVVGSPEIMREQLEHLDALAAEPHITVQVIPYAAGAHPGLAGQFSILRFADGPQAGVVYLKRFTSDLYLERESDLQRFGMMYDRLQAEALSPDGTRDLIRRAVKSHIDAASGSRAHAAGLQGPS